MKGFLTLALWLLAPFSTAQAQVALETWDASICVGCSSTVQFEAAARQIAGTSFSGEREILVINPQTNVSWFVTVFNTPPGTQPLSDPTTFATDSTEAGRVKINRSASTRVKLGTGTMLYADPEAFIIFADELDLDDVSIASSFTISKAANTSQQREIGALIDFGKGNFVITLPRSEFFSSFTGREPAAVGNELFRAMSEHNVGWATTTISNRIKQLIKNRLEHFYGRTFQVCAIFNNGDSACFSPDAATPSLEHLVDGSAKDKNGNAIASGGVSSGGSGGLNVSGDFSPNGAWGPTGSTGGSGELWLFCAFVGGVLDSCWTQII